jgi:polysaccharide biosynthesis transport protein
MISHQEVRLHLLDYWRVVRVRLGLVILVFALVVITAGVCTYLQPRQYKSFTTIEAQPELTPVRIFENQSGSSASNDSKFSQTQFQIIMRKGVLYPVIDLLNLQSKWASDGEALPKETTYNKLRGMLPLKRSGTLISFR